MSIINRITAFVVLGHLAYVLVRLYLAGPRFALDPYGNLILWTHGGRTFYVIGSFPLFDYEERLEVTRHILDELVHHEYFAKENLPDDWAEEEEQA